MPELDAKMRPVLMHSWSSARILDRQKTETRRKVPDRLQEADSVQRTGSAFAFLRGPADAEEVNLIEEITFYEPGDHLYVREPVYRGEDGRAYYEADDEPVIVSGTADPYFMLPDGKPGFFATWEDRNWSRDRQPAMFMPRAWSRTLLEVTEVGVERVQEICGKDAATEGISDWHPRFGGFGQPPLSERLIRQFRERWEDLHGPGAWHANDWVYVTRFKVIHPDLQL